MANLVSLDWSLLAVAPSTERAAIQIRYLWHGEGLA